MKKNTLTKKLTAGLLTGVMVLSMGTTAFADPTDPAGTGDGGEPTVETMPSDPVTTIKKRINKPKDVVLPNVTYNFSIAYDRETTGVADNLIDKEPSGVTFTDGATTATIVKQESEGNGIGEDVYEYIQTVAVVVDEDDFDTPGTYVYTVTENDPTPTYEGLSKDEPLEFVVVYGYEQNQDGTYAENASILFQGFANREGKKTNGIFEDDYGVNDEDGKLNDLTLTKKLSGNQADPTKDFEFTITITPGQDNTGKGYSIKEAGDEAQVREFEADGSETIRLKGNQTVTIYGLSASDTYVITEENYGVGGTQDEGYKTSWTIDVNGDGDNLNSTKNEHVLTTGDQNVDETSSKSVEAVEFTNYKNNSTPTGIAMTFAPYAVMVAFAGVFAVMFLRKKREDF